MQAVLWLVFGGTLALASYVSHRRTAALDVALDKPTVFGVVRVRLPSGWEKKPPPASGPTTDPSRPQALVLEELDEEGRPRRELWITQERQGAKRRGPAYYLETQLHVQDPRAERFDFLGTRGVIFRWRGLAVGDPDEIDPEEAEQAPAAGLYACVVLSDGTAVTLQVRGAGAYGPTNRRLIRQVADTMTVAN